MPSTQLYGFRIPNQDEIVIIGRLGTILKFLEMGLEVRFLK